MTYLFKYHEELNSTITVHNTVFWYSHVFSTCVLLSVTRMCVTFVSQFEITGPEEQHIFIVSC